MGLDDISIINEVFEASSITKTELDELLANGWRHFGQHFFRYNLAFFEYEIRFVNPLRIRLADFKLSKSKRRTLNKNKDLQTVIRPIEITAEKESLFESHKIRFAQNTPDSIYDFLDFDAANIPCQALEFCVYDKEKLLAVSFLDIGNNSVSSIYAMFEPNEAKRSLGIFTMLLEIEYAIKKGKKFYYQGYAYEGESFYDYKKNFSALEMFDWKGKWVDFSEPTKKTFF